MKRWKIIGIAVAFLGIGLLIGGLVSFINNDFKCNCPDISNQSTDNNTSITLTKEKSIYDDVIFEFVEMSDSNNIVYKLTNISKNNYFINKVNLSLLDKDDNEIEKVVADVNKDFTSGMEEKLSFQTKNADKAEKFVISYEYNE